MSDVVIVHGGMFIRCSSAEIARDFLVCLTGQRLVVLERAGARRVEPAIAKVATLEDIARKHASEPVRLAPKPEPEALHEPFVRAARAPRAPVVSPVMQHVRGEEPDLSAVMATQRRIARAASNSMDLAASEFTGLHIDTREPPAPKRRGRPPRQPSGAVQPGQLSRPRHDVRGADVDEPREERTRETSIADRIVRAFELDERQPLPELAAVLFGEQTGLAIRKLKLAIERLVSTSRLVRTGAASFRPVREAGTDDEDERDSDDQDDEASSFDSSEERPTNLDDEVLSELGIGLG